MPIADHTPIVEDAELRGGHLVLSRGRLQDWLSESLGAPCRVEPRRLRYKPGTSVVLAFDLTLERDGGPATQACLASAWSDHASPKMSKAHRRLPPDARLAHDPERHALVTTAAGDRALPVLERLARPDGPGRLLERLGGPAEGGGGPRIRSIRHNPGRRWVGTLEQPGEPTRLVRAYDSTATMTYAAACYRSLARGPAPTPHLLGRSRSWSVLAVTWAEGVDLAGHPGAEAAWEAAGRALATLHESRAHGLHRPDARRDLDAVRATARQVAVLLPELAPEVLHLADAVAHELRVLRRLPHTACTVHGDFSPDQVVVGPDGRPTIIDLDAARRGAPEQDLGCLTASTTIGADDGTDATTRAERLADFMTGYSDVRRPPADRAVALHAVAFGLRKAADPFRECAPDWREQVTRRVQATARALADVPPSGRS
ncbi:MAG TPA: phosphotransferase [Nocardioides sp.]|nr:phosphotransferase [Nocardioides sp.]